MTMIMPVEPNRNSQQANYNAVKIQINKPKTIIPEGFKNSYDDNGIYNAVNIQVDEPTVEVKKDTTYDYPEATELVTYEMAGIRPVIIPELPTPFAYNANLINNRTFINAEFEIENESKEDSEQKGIENISVVPEPNVTTTEAEKKNLNNNISFNGISFKANDAKKTIEIVPPVEIKPDVDIDSVVKNLSGNDFDKQAQQMEEIAKVAMLKPEDAVSYITADVFTGLIEIVKKDTSDLTPPNKNQIDTRKKIIINELVKEQAIKNNMPLSEIEVPYQLTKEEIDSAVNITTMEQAERNKEYALYTIAILSKIYADQIEDISGNIVPATDLPGISDVVDTLKNNQNAGVKIAAIDALRYISRPEYNEELESVFYLATKDSNEYVAINAQRALDSLETQRKNVA